MHVNWKAVAHIAAEIVGAKIPQVVAIESAIEGAITDPTNAGKAQKSFEASVVTLKAAAELAGKNFMTPRVERSLRRMNDESVELINAIAEAHG